MADLSDVETTLQGLIAGWVYPSGTSQPSAISLDSTPLAIKVGRGWPLKTQLMTDLAAKIVNITVFSQPGGTRQTTRFLRKWRPLTTPASTLTVAVSGETITLGGAAASGQLAAAVVNGVAYVYAVQGSDTLSTVAVALAALINVDTPATSTGPAITLTGAYSLAARVSTPGTAIRELRRQEQLFMITTWTVDPFQRDAAASFIDAKFAGAGEPNGLEFIALPDGSLGRLLYVRTAATDKDELSGAFRRDLIYSVEYPTTETMAAPAIVSIQTAMTAGPDSPGATLQAVDINL